jgi:hypothetical protein
MPELIHIVFFYLLANIGGTVAYFSSYKKGWAYWSDPVLTLVYFLTIGMVWSAIVLLLGVCFRNEKS